MNEKRRKYKDLTRVFERNLGKVRIERWNVVKKN
jgi:hypothetical protein